MTPAHLVSVLIEAAGSVLLLGYLVAALAALLRGRGPERAHLPLADDAVLSPGCKTGVSFPETLELGSWRRIGSFVAILALRTILRPAFAAEREMLLAAATQDGADAKRRQSL